jgi:hypothetical protein
MGFFDEPADSGPRSFDGELMEALRLAADVQTILLAATQYSARVTEFTRSLAETGNKMGNLYARSHIQAGDGVGGVVGGIAISLAAQLAASLVGGAGEAWNRMKHERAMREIQAQRRELAQLKRGVLVQAVPVLERNLVRLEGRMARDARREVDFEAMPRIDELHEGLRALFATC